MASSATFSPRGLQKSVSSRPPPLPASGDSPEGASALLPHAGEGDLLSQAVAYIIPDKIHVYVMASLCSGGKNSYSELLYVRADPP